MDEDIIELGNALMWLRPDVVTCGYEPVADHLHRGSSDVEWIPAVAELGLVAINDKIRTNPVEARIALESGARIVGLAGKVAQRSTWDRAVLLVRHWQAVENHIAAHPKGPWWLAVTQSGAEPRTFRGAMN
ncbi:MAG TPA: hypothetical protein VGR06_38695 [Actinophytocola sp.]|uniref:PIN-like domain-containing protein n=1 Tax=Actinophytocola sp. TaxID=1872138 RepID=UPI002DFCA18F|nr:hypothetical protein [Actinophytocola sp.]